jgi:colicin import membrane protein
MSVAYWNQERHEPGRAKAAVLALAVHVLFLAFLVFGVSWKTREPDPVVVELWNVPPAAKPAPVMPAPMQEVKPEPRPEPKPEPKVEPKPRPEPKADIRLKEKQEKERLEKLRLEEQKKKDEQKRKEELQKKLEAEQAEKARQQAQAAAMQAQRAREERLFNDAVSRIRGKIKRNVIMPPDIKGNPEAEFQITLLPTGEVLHARMVRSSGHAAYDAAVERAILKSSPLPLPEDRSLFDRFREFNLKFRPVE